MQLIENIIPGKWKVIRESNSNGVQKIKLAGTAGRVDEVNKNKRLYPRKVLESAIGNLSEKINNRELVGALDHPTNSNNLLSQASHLITKLWIDKNEILWEAEVLPTPAGTILRNLIDADVRVGISSRGEGSLVQNDDGTSTVSEDYRLVTFDIVADPSTRGAYASLTESAQNTEKVNSIIRKSQGTQVFLTLLKNRIDERIKSNRDAIRNMQAKEGDSIRDKLASDDSYDGQKSSHTEKADKFNDRKGNRTKAGNLHAFRNDPYTVNLTPEKKAQQAKQSRKYKASLLKKSKNNESVEDFLDRLIESLETRGAPAHKRSKEQNAALKTEFGKANPKDPMAVFKKKQMKKAKSDQHFAGTEKEVNLKMGSPEAEKKARRDAVKGQRFRRLHRRESLDFNVKQLIAESKEGAVKDLKSAQLKLRDAALELMSEFKKIDIENQPVYEVKELLNNIKTILDSMDEMGWKAEYLTPKKDSYPPPMPAPEYKPKTLKNLDGK